MGGVFASFFFDDFGGMAGGSSKGTLNGTFTTCVADFLMLVTLATSKQRPEWTWGVAHEMADLYLGCQGPVGFC